MNALIRGRNQRFSVFDCFNRTVIEKSDCCLFHAVFLNPGKKCCNFFSLTVEFKCQTNENSAKKTLNHPQPEQKYNFD